MGIHTLSPKRGRFELHSFTANFFEGECCYNPVVRSKTVSILIAEDNEAQRQYVCGLITQTFPGHLPILEASDGESAARMAVEMKPDLAIFDIQMPKLSGVKAARAVWREFPAARIIFWTQFPHEIYINEIRKIVKSVSPPPGCWELGSTRRLQGLSAEGHAQVV